MATSQQREDTLWAAIESGRLDGPAAADSKIAGRFAAYQELESLFALVRQPASVISKIESPLDHPATIGRYRICRVLGWGAFGVVYLADDPDLARAVAIKVPRPERFTSEADASRFMEEARSAAGLKHPGIVTVYDVGRDGDRCYIVMEYVRGRTLEELIQTERLSPTAAAGFVARVADALHYADKKGFVHRDLKPSNILVDDRGHPHVTDFGLAVSEETQLLRAGQIAGTPAYMSPEQARGETQYIDGRTDIWGLGVVLYQLLTGRQPFETGSAQEYFDQVERREPKPPRQIDDTIPGELESITLKCLAKRTTERYSTAADLAAELRRFQPKLRDEAAIDHATAGRPSTQGRRLARWAAAVAVVGVLLLMIALAVWPGLTTAGKLTGTIDVVIWNSGNAQRRDLSLSDDGALPLIAGDEIRVEASVNRPSYLYVVWISPDGRASAVYPWSPGDWGRRPDREEPVSSVSLPEGLNTGWPMQGPAGMETLVLLARATPLPAEIRLRELLSGFPRQEIQDPRAIVWLDRGKVVDTLERAPQFFNPREIDDPVLTTQRLLAERLSPHFQLIRAVSFANVAPTRE